MLLEKLKVLSPKITAAESGIGFIKGDRLKELKTELAMDTEEFANIYCELKGIDKNLLTGEFYKRVIENAHVLARTKAEKPKPKQVYLDNELRVILAEISDKYGIDESKAIRKCIRMVGESLRNGGKK